MKLHEAVKPISYVKAHACEVLKRLAEDRQPLVITHNGEARAVLMDVEEYERMQESLALLKLLAMSERSLDKEGARPLAEAMDGVRGRIGRGRVGGA